jgi:hypothetical protein
MKKLTLRSEHLGQLSTEDLRRVAGAQADAAGTLSAGSCVCTNLLQLAFRCGVSDGSCACVC